MVRWYMFIIVPHFTFGFKFPQRGRSCSPTLGMGARPRRPVSRSCSPPRRGGTLTSIKPLFLLLISRLVLYDSPSWQRILMSMAVTRRQIVRACKARGWQIQPDALKGLEAYLQRYDGIDEALFNAIAEYMEDTATKTLTSAIWQEYLKDQESFLTSNSCSRSDKAPDGPAWSADVQVVSAFQDVRLSYHTMKKQFQVEEQPWSLFGKAEDKIYMHLQRYTLTHQRLLRHKDFRPTDLMHLGTTNESVQYKLTPIESLLGRQKHRGHTSILLLGFLQQVEEGQYYLEDLTGQVPMSFQHALVMEGFFVAEGNILLVEGVFQDGILYALRIGHPMLEEREESLSIIQQQVRHPAFSQYELSLSDAPLVALSDVHLDQPLVMQQLEALFASFENYSLHRLPLFCLMGNFCSKFQLHPGDSVRHALEELASLIGRFPRLASNAHFCLVPGPNDGVGHVLPYSWPKSLRAMACWNKIPNAHLTSNPAKIHWNGCTVTVFRHNVLSLMQQQQIPLPVDKNGEEVAKVPHLRLIKTLLDQGHLLPLSNAPIYWNYDHALRLYPLPDALILGSSDSNAFYEAYGGVDIFHPGSFVKQGDFSRYNPGATGDDGDPRISLDRLDENWNNRIVEID